MMTYKILCPSCYGMGRVMAPREMRPFLHRTLEAQSSVCKTCEEIPGYITVDRRYAMRFAAARYVSVPLPVSTQSCCS